MKRTAGDFRMKFRLILSATLGVIIIFSTLKDSLSADNTALEEEMVLIPSGEFLIGSTERDGRLGISIGVDEVPQHRVSSDAFYIDLYEVTNRQYKKFVDTTDHPTPEDPHSGTYSWRENAPQSGQENLPVTQVSWYDAGAYCKWTGKRLPTEAEWEKAARSTDGRQWPWGNKFNENACNTKHITQGEILPVGSIPDDRSPYGVYDMCGNVSEWTSSWYLPYPGSSLQRESFGETYKVTRGGSWVMPAIPYSRAAYRANTYEPGYKHRGIGFRCAKDSAAHPPFRKGG